MNAPAITTLTATLLLTACTTPEAPGPAGQPINNTLSPRPAMVLANYGQLVSFSGDKVLRYPHFELVFLGTKLDQSDLLPAHILPAPSGALTKSEFLSAIGYRCPRNPHMRCDLPHPDHARQGGGFSMGDKPKLRRW